MASSKDPRARQPAFEFLIHRGLAVQSSASYLIAFCLHFSICKSMMCMADLPYVVVVRVSEITYVT